MILFYTDEPNPRIKYVAKLIFTDILQSEVLFTTKAEEFMGSLLPKMNYSNVRFDDEFYIRPNRFLYSEALVRPVINTVFYEGERYFFESSKDSDLPFDPFAAAFYLVTRYEEYLNTKLDKYQRYPAGNSILMKYGMLKKPVVNIWAHILADCLKKRFPGINFPGSRFRFLSTIDIDNAWLYSHKGFIRSAGAFTKAFLRGRFDEVKNRFEVLSGGKQDPYHTYQYINKVFEGNEDKVIFFFLLGNYSRYDKNISFKNEHFKKLVYEIAEKYTIGIHPSFSSGMKNGKLAEEIDRLEKISGHRPLKSRHHFIRLKMPDTYKDLIRNGIEEDYTMGYASHSGFRAGICTPYYFYDLEKETATTLKIFPFQVMDVTLRDYMGSSPRESLNEIENLMSEVKNVGGIFVSIWHNESLNDMGSWKGYRAVFEKMNKKGFEWANE